MPRKFLITMAIILCVVFTGCTEKNLTEENFESIDNFKESAEICAMEIVEK